ncbi:MAG: 3'(2'),5'-bisphosphate nucleotidase CysQ [Odoribacteraceae bacterium]|jgi:3'(2'), 5'-bisphosphate nucleotidase|nr:3'(2'),5'-bisphosphate nucleotidase CysQ [Odoribacteraceae bacterium]
MLVDDNDVAGVQAIVKEAGEILRAHYHSATFAIDFKKDHSPLTDADRDSNTHIVDGLRRLYPRVPVISEESDLPDYRSRAGWDLVWIVDPLDGTEEFIERNGRFCVNVALVERKTPIFGMINIINDDEILWGATGKGCHLCKGDQTEPVRPPVRQGKRLRVGVSRFHVMEEEFRYIDLLQKRGHDVEIVPLSASSKYGMVAKGEIDIAPKFGRCFEWDVAAGHALVEASGGLVINAQTGGKITYNNTSVLTPPLVMYGARVHELIRGGNADFLPTLTR